MKKAALLLLAVMASFSLNAFSPDAPDAPAKKKKIAGTYNLDIDSPYGTVPAILDVKKVKKTFEVSLTPAEEGAQPLDLKDVVVEDNKITFSFYYEGMDIGMELTIEGDKVSGLMMGEYNVSGTRAPK